MSHGMAWKTGLSSGPPCGPILPAGQEIGPHGGPYRGTLRGDPVSGVGAAVRAVEQVHGVDDPDRQAALLDLARDLEDAADVARGDDLGARGGDVLGLAPAEAVGHLGLG